MYIYVYMMHTFSAPVKEKPEYSGDLRLIKHTNTARNTILSIR